MSLRRALVAVLLPLAALRPDPLAAQGAAEGAPTVPVALARALAAPGALERALAPRSYRDPRGGRVTAAGTREGALLRFAVKFQVVGGMREESTETSWTLDPTTGAIRGLRLRVVRGRQETSGEGEVRDGRLRVVLRHAGGDEAEARDVAWGDDVLPFALAVFLLPRLASDLPPALSFRPFHGATLTLADEPARLTRGDDAVLLEGLLAGLPPVRIALTPAGPSDVTLAPGEVLTPISADERARHLDDDAR